MTTPVASGIAKETTLARRFGGAKLAFAARLTASSSITPAAGKSIRLLWVAFVPDPDGSPANLVTIKWSGAVGALYVGYALAHWERFDAPAADTPLLINLSNTQAVAVTIHYEEYTP